MESKNDIWEMGELLSIIKQEVKARETSKLVNVHSTMPPGGAHNLPFEILLLMPS